MDNRHIYGDLDSRRIMNKLGDSILSNRKKQTIRKVIILHRPVAISNDTTFILKDNLWSHLRIISSVIAIINPRYKSCKTSVGCGQAHALITTPVTRSFTAYASSEDRYRRAVSFDFSSFPNWKRCKHQICIIVHLQFVHVKGGGSHHGDGLGRVEMD